MGNRIPSGQRLALALALALAGAACAGSDGMLAPNQGRVRFVLGADGGALAAPGAVDVGAVQPARTGEGPGDGEHRPRPLIKAANVTFTSILARNLDGVLVDVDMDLPVTVDVVTLETGKQIQLPEGELPAATYDQVVVVMKGVSLVLWDDTEISITPPGGGWTAIVPICPPLVVEEGGESTVSLTLDVKNAFFAAGNLFRFEPRFRGCRPAPPPDDEIL
jgi:hypothetical protein